MPLRFRMSLDSDWPRSHSYTLGIFGIGLPIDVHTISAMIAFFFLSFITILGLVTASKQRSEYPLHWFFNPALSRSRSIHALNRPIWVSHIYLTQVYWWYGSLIQKYSSFRTIHLLVTFDCIILFGCHQSPWAYHRAMSDQTINFYVDERSWTAI